MSDKVLELPGLVDKIAVVTGASRGIGAAIARELARHGADVVLTARDPAPLAEVAAEVKSLGRRSTVVAGDLTLPDFGSKVVNAAIETFGRVDLLVNNAGATKRGNFVDLTDADWDDGFALKFFGAVRMCRLCWPELRKSRGAVLNIGGAGGRTPDKPFTIGSSVNAAMMAFTKALADLGREDDVRVNLVNPGLIRTDRLEKRIVDAMKADGITRELAEQQLSNQAAITHIGEAEDIARIVAFMLSDSGMLFHGSLVDADAGYTKGV
ncbi:SDR family NAD(P)-dependent oxidoreductase [Microvirga antarctica]|uniref:SDR family NAD(P)-dependent oxidoreductase n=1 Tax=Microvirga antarctica TaxID=2819233 RepID=UPI001B3022D8